MSSNVNATKKLSLVSLILMIFTSVYGFNNIPRSFYKMGYAAIPWYIISGIAFFIPFALMMAEFGAAFKNEKGGIYSWMEKSVGPRFAFIGTFMWFASYVIWMVNVSSGIWVPISNAIFGKDTTATWKLFGIEGLTGPKTLGILGIIWFILVTFVSTKGVDKIKKVTSVGGSAVVLINIVVLLGAIAVFIGNGGQLAQPIEGLKSFTTTPNPKFAGNSISALAFVVYALFAYGGIEAVGGLVDQTENPEKTFPKGVMISAAVIAIGYSLLIFMIGIFTNWSAVMSMKGVTLGNASYIVMSNLGYSLGTAFGASEATAVLMGQWISRYIGLSMFLALSGAFFTLTYSPLKQLIDGTPRALWPGKVGETRKSDGMPVNAMWIQCIIVVVMIALVSFGGDSMAKFFEILVSMTNVAMTIPYMFLSIAFIAFKKKQEIEKPFEVYKSYSTALIWGVIVTLTVGFANFFSIIEPALGGDLPTTIWQIAGPIFFGLVAVLMFNSYEKKCKSEKGRNVA
ncbi:glutamate/gamma-aminobutyrate family transporter YjeM [Clostridium swellfunianum]|uniref:glutamate/gamma-aminobutyrate family transporter YjeM n=1 Tax=Clostridium swellfunianum TaxID=1367462 RepID=UPI00202EE47D|nr:glutamate/gamma-aminobutyrate family transporter YjeM [Clostridium swellfunianum]MCM0649153.1 glutamate/gamma-aminobutyrate family transporter YjeM [Clostridium swellfunianum]